MNFSHSYMLTDSSYRVNYEIEKSGHIHKSMLLRGIKLPPPILNSSDIQAIKNKSHSAGRSFGGAPMRNNRNNGNDNRPDRMSVTAGRPNPFAAFLDPRFLPPFPGHPFNNGYAVPMPPFNNGYGVPMPPFNNSGYGGYNWAQGR